MRVILPAIFLAAAFGCSQEQFGVKRIEPTLGLSRGGEKVTIYGSGFDKEPMITVYFGNARAEYASISGPDRIRVNTPNVSHTGKVDVRVVAGDGTEFLLREGFEFVARNRMAECVNIGRALNGKPITKKKSIRSE